jgi:hypothetical protein
MQSGSADLEVAGRCDGGTEYHMISAAALQGWKTLIDLIQTDPYARSVTMFDVLNEPDARGLGWNTTGPLYIEVAEHAYSVNPGAPQWRSQSEDCVTVHDIVRTASGTACPRRTLALPTERLSSCCWSSTAARMTAAPRRGMTRWAASQHRRLLCNCGSLRCSITGIPCARRACCLALGCTHCAAHAVHQHIIAQC